MPVNSKAKESLERSHSDLVSRQWDFSKNIILPSEITFGSRRLIWWRCEEHNNHIWEESPKTKTKKPLGYCPVCNNTIVLPGVNDIFTTHPFVKEDWNDYNFDPLKMVAGSLQKINWKCKNDHEWIATIRSRALYNVSCKICNNQELLIGFNDLITQYPELISELKPADYNVANKTICTSIKRFNFSCQNNHTQKSSFKQRQRLGCTICLSKGSYDLIPYVNDIQTLFPEHALLFHSELNDITPDKITPFNSKDKYYWHCKDYADHVYQRTARDQIIENKQCIYCCNQKVLVDFNDLATTNPEMAKQLHPTMNGEITAQNINTGSTTNYYWQCEKDINHYWFTSPSIRKILNSDCPYCVNQKIMVGNNDLFTTNPEAKIIWSPNNTINPQELTAGSNKNIEWICEVNHKHIYIMSVRSKIILQKKCHYCCGQKVLQGEEDLETLYPTIAQDWHPTKNDDKLPSEYSPESAFKAWWFCDICDYEWKSGIYLRVKGGRKGKFLGCPRCSNRIVTSGVNDLSITNPRLFEEIHPTLNNDKDLTRIAPRAKMKLWWQCLENENHDPWLTTVDKRFNTGCPACSRESKVSRKEQELLEFITSILPDDTIIKTSDRTAIKPLELDIYLPELKIAIEFNGVYWHSEACGKDSTYHYNKWKKCQDLGIELLQIWEDDWDYHKDKVKHKFQSCLIIPDSTSNDSNVIISNNVPLDGIIDYKVNYFVSNVSDQFSTIGYYSSDILCGLLDFEIKNSVCTIFNYLPVNYNINILQSFIDYLCSNYVITSFNIILSNENNYLREFKNNGFVLTEEFAPEFMQIKGNVRVSSNDDLRLKVWDSGYSLYVLVIV